MIEEAVERRLAAILAADVVGYSRLMGQDEAGTLAVLRKLRAELVEPKIEEHKGRLFKATGDGFLVEFPSVVNAVACAVDIQRSMLARYADQTKDRVIQLRIGVNLGDVVIEDNDVFGDGVNVAARLEGIAPVGAVAISSAVFDQLGNRLNLRFEDLGELLLKNIDKPVRVFAVRPGHLAMPEHSLPPVPSKPSIAVLPFQNMSGEAEQEYFADGIVEDIITALSRFNALFVIARNSSFTYKGRAIDIKQVGRELGVRYALEGSVRKSGNRVRITGQLIDASTGAHLWADRFDGQLEDVFDLQDQVTASVVGAIAPKLEQAEIERARRKPTDSLDAYDYYLRGMANLHSWNQDANVEALVNFSKAIELDASFSSAYGNAVRCYVQRKAAGWTVEHAHETLETLRLAKLAVKTGKDDAVALCTAGMGIAFVAGDVSEGDALTDRALQLNPNLAWAWMFSGWIKVWCGEAELGIERATRAMRLSPQDTQVFAMQGAIATAHYLANRPEAALSWAESAMSVQPNFLVATTIAAASAATIGQHVKAGKILAHLRSLNPSLGLSNLDELMPFRDPRDAANLVEGLRKAGLHQ